MSESEIPKPRGCIIIIYAQSNAGKSTLCGHITDSEYARPALMYDAEAGSAAVAHIPQERLTVRRVRNWKHVTDAVQYLENTPEEKLQHKCYIFDNLTEILEMNLNHHGLRTSADVGEGSGMDTRHYYMKSDVDIRQLVRRLRDVAETKRVVIVIVAWDREREGSLRINVNPRTMEKIPGVVDIIGHISEINGVRILSFESKATRDSKFRRSFDSIAQTIPLRMLYDVSPLEMTPTLNGHQRTVRDSPLAEIVDTLLGGKPFPREKYINRTA